MKILSSRPADNCIILHDNSTGNWLHFEKPVQVYVVNQPSMLLESLKTIEYAVDRQGLYAAGFLGYEAAHGINPELPSAPTVAFPLCWFGLYERPQVVNLPLPSATASGPPDWQTSVDQERYDRTVAHIKEHIRKGNTYQANYSYRLRSTLSCGWDIFCQMIAAQRPGYSAYIELPDWTVCSVSPELFFALDGQKLTCRPMKGTAPRGLFLPADNDYRDSLQESSKERAENLMIVDMVRNDMSRIAGIGTVRVNSLFDVEKYPTLWQLTSSIECRSDSGLTEVLQALFPAASITGAPKRRTMEILAGLECSPRNIYTGTIGYYAPGRKAQFNVAIRTLLIDKHTRLAEYGVGSGIVWDSVIQSEWQETRTKAAVLGYLQPEFSLLESLLWEPGKGYWLFQEHLDRLRESAGYFEIPFNENVLVQKCEQFAAELEPVPFKIRVLLDRQGGIDIQAEPVSARKKPVHIGIAQYPVDIFDRFIYHKTTYRKVYEDALTEGFDDVILFNREGEITETTTANIIVEIEGKFYTPPVKCGLLAGTYRARLLREGRISERCIRLDELKDCTAIHLINSVRGWWPVILENKSG